MLDGLRWTSIAAYLSFATLILSLPFQERNSQSASDSQSQSTGAPAPLTPQNSNPDPLAGNAAAQRTVTATKRWLAGTMSTPGIGAQLREISRATIKEQLEVQYHIFVPGAPKHQT